MGLHPPEAPPHHTTQRWLPYEQVTCIAGFQPIVFHWKQVEVVSPLFVWRHHGVSLTPAITYGVPRRSMTPSPRVDP
jgi:hypothetical protein